MGSSSAAEAASGTTSQQYLYESRYGLPVVRRRLSYGELLKAMREEQVDELLFFSQEVG